MLKKLVKLFTQETEISKDKGRKGILLRPINIDELLFT